jgi:hypothetical protein
MKSALKMSCGSAYRGAYFCRFPYGHIRFRGRRGLDIHKFR